MLRAIDLYLGRQMLRAWGLVIGTIVAILSLENLTRITAAVQNTATPLPLLGWLTASLVPEYLGIGIPVGVYLAVTLAIRSLSLRGEWQMVEALGIAPRRYMLVPMLLALLSCGCQLAVRLDIQPRGERSLDHLYGDVERGFYGAMFPPGEVLTVARHTTLVTQRVDPDSGELSGVLIRQGPDILTAEHAKVSIADNGALTLVLRDGTVIESGEGGATHAVAFKQYRMALDGKAPAPFVAAKQLNWLTFGELRGLIASGDPAAAPATAEIVARVSNAAFCLLLPWFALAFGVPPRRSTGGAAISLGVLLIVLFFKLSDAVQENFADVAIAAGLVHAALWIGFTVALIWFVRRDPGTTMDERLARIPWRKLLIVPALIQRASQSRGRGMALA